MDKADLLKELEKELPQRGIAVVVWNIDALRAGEPDESKFVAYLEKPMDELFDCRELRFAEGNFFMDNRATMRFRRNLRDQGAAAPYNPDSCFVFLPIKDKR